jgi:hypothetical protein
LRSFVFNYFFFAQVFYNRCSGYGLHRILRHTFLVGGVRVRATSRKVAWPLIAAI